MAAKNKKIQKREPVKESGGTDVIPLRQRELWLDPYRNLLNMQAEFNRLWNQPIFGFPALKFPSLEWQSKEFEGLERIGKIAVDVSDQKDKLIVKADIPGLKKEDLDISVQDKTLVIKGEKKEEKETKGKDFVRKERTFGSFYRAIDLPSEVDAAKVTANYKNGVLELALPKSKEALAKRVKINIKG